MILGLGIDSVEIFRFALWAQMPRKSLERVFSLEEIAYCLSCPTKSSERFAARFAAREALLKALQVAFPTHKFNLLRLCRHITIKKGPQGQITMHLDWAQIDLANPYTIHVSWTHTKTIATTVVCLESK